jgi:flagellar M-ring protein FliF
VTYQRALEGELGRSIQTLSNVETARVHLVMAADSVFADQQQQGKASVILTLRSGSLTKEEALAITRLVAGAVGQLKPDDVAIIDADSGRSLSGNQDQIDSGGDSDLTARLISTLEPVAGPGKIRASVSVAYDQGTVDENEEKYDPDVSAVLSDQKTEDQEQGANIPSGVPGTTSNVPSVASTKPSVTPSTQHSITENKQFAVNRTVVHTVTPAGRVQRISAAILVDDNFERKVENGAVHFIRHKRSPEEMEQIRNLAETVIGYDAKRGDAISVENISFNSETADLDMPAPTLLQQTQKAVTDYSSAIRPLLLLGLFLLAYFLVFRPVQKRVLSAATALPALPGRFMADDAEALPVVTAEMHTLRAAQLKKQALETVRQNPLQTTRAVQGWLREENS